MTETRPAYGTPIITRDEWEAARYAEMKRLMQEHSTVRFHLEFKDGLLVAFSAEPVYRYNARRMDNHRAERGTVTP